MSIVSPCIRRFFTVEQTDAAQKQYNEALAEYNEQLGQVDMYTGMMPASFNDTAKALSIARDDLAAYTAEEERLQEDVAKLDALIVESERDFKAYAQALEDAAAAMTTQEKASQAASLAMQSVYDDMTALIEGYNKSYEAAYSSISGQYDLWDKAAAVVATSAATINSAMESQIKYWQDYNANLAGLSERGADIEGLSEMISSFADGSEKSVNAIAGMSNATDEELGAMVASWQELQKEHDAVATSLAKMETDFDNSMSKIKSNMEKSIVEMNMSAEAEAAAKSTIDAYVRAIESGVARAQTAAEAVANATSSALGSSGISTAGLPGVAVVEANAGGTTNAADVFLAGEKGPELIVGAGGSTVFPTDETNRILTAMEDRPINAPVPAGFTGSESAVGGMDSSGSFTTEKKITLEINGKGPIDISGNIDKGQILEVLTENVRDVLIGILRQEQFEEGDLAYEF